VLVITGCLIWRSAGSGSTPALPWVLRATGNLRIGSIAVNTMLASASGMISAMLYMWFIV